MQTKQWTVQRLAALGLVVMLLMFCGVLRAHAAEDPEEYAAVEEKLDQLQVSWDDTPQEAEAKYEAYNILLQQYPEWADVRFERAYFMMWYASTEEEWQGIRSEYEAAAALAEAHPDEKYYRANYWDGYIGDYAALIYEEEADLCLNRLKDQAGYLDAMEKALDQREQEWRSEAAYAQEDAEEVGYYNDEWLDNEVLPELIKVVVQKKQLQEIRTWVQAGSPQVFTAWDGRVQADCAVGNKTMSVLMRTPGASDTLELRGNKTVPIRYEAVKKEYVFQQPIYKVLRSINELICPLEHISFEQWKMTYTLPDGTVQEYDPEMQRVSEEIGTYKEFCTWEELDLPAGLAQHAAERWQNIAAETVQFSVWENEG